MFSRSICPHCKAVVYMIAMVDGVWIMAELKRLIVITPTGHAVHGFQRHSDVCKRKVV